MTELRIGGWLAIETAATMFNSLPKLSVLRFSFSVDKVNPPWTNSWDGSMLFLTAGLAKTSLCELHITFTYDINLLQLNWPSFDEFIDSQPGIYLIHFAFQGYPVRDTAFLQELKKTLFPLISARSMRLLQLSAEKPKAE